MNHLNGSWQHKRSFVLIIMHDRYRLYVLYCSRSTVDSRMKVFESSCKWCFFRFNKISNRILFIKTCYKICLITLHWENWNLFYFFFSYDFSQNRAKTSKSLNDTFFITISLSSLGVLRFNFRTPCILLIHSARESSFTPHQAKSCNEFSNFLNKSSWWIPSNDHVRIRSRSNSGHPVYVIRCLYR